ncbi:hypothetical protein O8B39_23720 [Agrobacterium rhizogenes]|nr:hypothetical protein [Rhizobium rhizogenes]
MTGGIAVSPDLFHAQSFSLKRACRAKVEKGWKADFGNKKPGKIAGLMLVIVDPSCVMPGLTRHRVCAVRGVSRDQGLDRAGPRIQSGVTEPGCLF